MCKHQTLHSHSTTGSLQASVSPLASSSGGRLSAFHNCQCMRNAESGSNRVHLPWGPLFCAHRQIGLFFLLCSLELWVQVLVSFLVVVQFLGLAKPESFCLEMMNIQILIVLNISLPCTACKKVSFTAGEVSIFSLFYSQKLTFYFIP